MKCILLGRGLEEEEENKKDLQKLVSKQKKKKFRFKQDQQTKEMIRQIFKKRNFLPWIALSTNNQEEVEVDFV